jgi:hypothetical protein
MAENNPTAKPDGTISCTKGAAFMPLKVRKLLGTDIIAYIALGKVTILFNPNTPIPELKQALQSMTSEVEQRPNEMDIPCNSSQK